VSKERTEAAKISLKRHIQQMMTSGNHDIGAIVAAMREILEEWS
jgi:hypothetical protein